MTPSKAKKVMSWLMRRWGIEVDSRFVPFSCANPGESAERVVFHKLNKNWSVTIKIRNRAILETKYRTGVAHCVTYPKNTGHLTVAQASLIRNEVEENRRSPLDPCLGNTAIREVPDPADVLGVLLLDSEAIGYASFEEWANEYGYSTDSRKAEETYTICLKHGLALRGTLGEKKFRILQTTSGTLLVVLRGVFL